ncbi:MAG: flagellar M-ring protein FliF [Pelosinus sp.]|nr:flagellar M-ring protein FliF [Pelosinus sp.]
MADWKEQSLRLWQNLGKKQRYMIIGAAIFVFVGILSWSYWWGAKPDLVPLFTNMEAEAAGEVAAKLKEMKVNFEPQETNKGMAILVPSKDVYRIRMELASQGLPRGNKGFEIFEQNKFGTTEFQNKVNLVQALQGELTRTIEQMAEVEKARVHIVMPEDSLYKKNEKPATASIMLKLRYNTQLSREQVKGIVNLAAHSIQGLKPENITVVDSKAKVLNEEDPAAAAGSGTMTQLEMTKKVQDDLQKNLQSLLEQVLGSGKAAARVNVELSFDQRTTDKQVYEPVVDDKGIVRSSQDVNENYKGTSQAPPGGVPGTTTNIPGYVTNSNNQSNYEKKEAIRNYEINETKEKVVAAPGSIKRLSVAVLVDSSLNKAQQDSIAKTVSSAIGINTARGDSVSVEAISFNTELLDKQKAEEADYARQQNLAFWGKVILALLLVAIPVGYFVYSRRKKQRVAEEMAAAAILEDDFLPASEVEEEELSPEQVEEMSKREAVENMAKTQPEDVAQLIRTWLTEE